MFCFATNYQQVALDEFRLPPRNAQTPNANPIVFNIIHRCRYCFSLTLSSHSLLSLSLQFNFENWVAGSACVVGQCRRGLWSICAYTAFCKRRKTNCHNNVSQFPIQRRACFHAVLSICHVTRMCVEISVILMTSFQFIFLTLYHPLCFSPAFERQPTTPAFSARYLWSVDCVHQPSLKHIF